MYKVNTKFGDYAQTHFKATVVSLAEIETEIKHCKIFTL